MYGGAAVSYGSKRQHCISLSSTEAEIVAASHIAEEVIYTSDACSRRWGARRHAQPRCLSTTWGPWNSRRSGALADARDMLIDAT
eukprot:3678878-Pleurochrysis_carterae.AAC.1